MKTYVTKEHKQKIKASLANRARHVADRLVPEAAGGTGGKIPSALAARWNSVYWEALDELNAQAGTADMVVPSDRLLPSAIRRANREYPRVKAWNRNKRYDARGEVIPPPDEMINKWERLVEQYHTEACQLAGLVV